MSFEDKIKRVIKDLAKIIHKRLVFADTYFGLALAQTIKKNSPVPYSQTKKVSGNVLNLRTGKLWRSYNSRETTSGTKHQIKGNVIESEYKSNLPYADIHETGGFIKATPYKTKTGRNSYKMAGFFWHRYIKYKNPYWKHLALHVMKEGGVTIPKREYLKKASEIYKNKYIDQFASEIIDELILNIND